MSVIKLGGTVTVMQKFDAERALQLIEQHQITHSQWVPTMFVRMLKLPKEVRTKYDCSSQQIALLRDAGQIADRPCSCSP